MNEFHCNNCNFQRSCAEKTTVYQKIVPESVILLEERLVAIKKEGMPSVVTLPIIALVKDVLIIELFKT